MFSIMFFFFSKVHFPFKLWPQTFSKRPSDHSTRPSPGDQRCEWYGLWPGGLKEVALNFCALLVQIRVDEVGTTVGKKTPSYLVTYHLHKNIGGWQKSR